MKIIFENKRINIQVNRTNFFSKLYGLMFKKRNTNNLLFEFGEEKYAKIHSFFVFFPFLAVWLDKNNKVVDIGLVKPFTLSVKPKKSSAKLIELPANNKNKKIFQLLVGKGKI